MYGPLITKITKNWFPHTYNMTYNMYINGISRSSYIKVFLSPLGVYLGSLSLLKIF